MLNLIPTPKSVHQSEGVLRFPRSQAVPVRAYGTEAEACRDWFAGSMEREQLVSTCREAAIGGCAVHIGLLSFLEYQGLADGAWRSSVAFRTPVGQEQGYVLEVSERGAVVAALGPQGLQHGAATLLQLLRLEGEAAVAPCCRIEDWPDVRFRAAADWLLNVEINRWGLERGDGRDALLARMKRKIDLAARFKINAIWFDGFGWSVDRIPGYVDFARELAGEAARRHVRLAYAGYGGGYGFAYQRSQLYRSPYQGIMHENRASDPAGPVYECVGHGDNPVSRRYGTCLSNAELAERKLAELTRFVRECRPGMLYIHDIDSGHLEWAQKGWKLRCARCRQRWPDDRMVSEQGGAAAYASWYRQVARAISAVQTEDGDYVAARDCQIAFVSPVYTVYEDQDDTWTASCDYFALVSKLVGPFPNVQFGIREQFASDMPPGPRVAQLKRGLDAVGNGHGVFVIAISGGDNYYNDELVSPSLALQSHYEGAETVYAKTLSSVVEPAQVVCAEYAWHSAAPGAFSTTCSRQEMLDLLKRCRAGVEHSADIHGPNGLVRRACDRLYGHAAGHWLAQLFTLGAGTGVFPVVTGWGAVTKEVRRLLDKPDSPAEECRSHWQRRESLTNSAISLARAALAERFPDEAARDDIGWLRTRLEIGLRLCRALAACWDWRGQPTDLALVRVSSALGDLETFLNVHVPTDTTDPIGGDPFIWRETLAKLSELTEKGP
jgi:hypothetical protein